MAYDEDVLRRRGADGAESGAYAGSRFRGANGFREETDFRPSVYDANGVPDSEATAVTGRGSAALDDVFDDPNHGEPGRDRMTVHIVWEIVLLVGIAAVCVLLFRAVPGSLRGQELDLLLVSAAALGLVGLAAGLSLRAGAVNLAIGPVAVAASLYYAENGERGVVLALGVAVAAAAVLGLAVGLLVAGVHVPGWAASLVAALVVIVYIQRRTAPVEVTGEYAPTRHAVYVFGAVAALALIGGVLGTVKAVRRFVGRFRPVLDPARRRGGLAAALTVAATALSMAFAAGAGVLAAAASPDPVVPDPGLALTGLGLGAALLGGTSAFGRRGGVFGTLFAAVLITVFVRYSDSQGWRISLLVTAAAAMVGGLLVTRAVERFGTPRSRLASDGLDWATRDAESRSPIWSEGREGSWSAALPAQSADPRRDDWDDGWGGSPR